MRGEGISDRRSILEYLQVEITSPHHGYEEVQCTVQSEGVPFRLAVKYL